MCLITDIKTKFIAEEDIVVYKALNKTSDANTVKSPYQHTEYNINELYKTTIKKSNEWCCFDDTDHCYLEDHYPKWDKGDIDELICFGEGFHSAIDKKRLKQQLQFRELYKCIIPKGSEYYKDATGLIVSNQIIIKCLAE